MCKGKGLIIHYPPLPPWSPSVSSSIFPSPCPVKPLRSVRRHFFRIHLSCSRMTLDSIFWVLTPLSSLRCYCQPDLHIHFASPPASNTPHWIRALSLPELCLFPGLYSHYPTTGPPCTHLHPHSSQWLLLPNSRPSTHTYHHPITMTPTPTRPYTHTYHPSQWLPLPTAGPPHTSLLHHNNSCFPGRDTFKYFETHRYSREWNLAHIHSKIGRFQRLYISNS